MAPIKYLASQAKSINLYKNLRVKVKKYWSNIYFNGQCLNEKATLKYCNIADSLYISFRRHHPKGSTDNPNKSLNLIPTCEKRKT